jgi:hypothetical protein
MTTQKRILRIGIVVLGLALIALPFAAHLYIDARNSVSVVHIAVVRRDIEPGHAIALDDVRFEEQVLNPSLAKLYVKRDEFDDFADGFVVDRIRTGEPLLKVKLVSSDQGLRLKRYALALEDPNDVIMTLPVGPDLIPGYISTGDSVNIIFTSGGKVSESNTPNLAASVQSRYALHEAQPGEIASVPGAPSAFEVAPPDQRAVPPAELDANVNGALALPVADVMLENVQILEINFAPLDSPDAQMRGAEHGPIASIVVRVPRAYQTLLAFGASASQLRYSIASPKADVAQMAPVTAMSWGKYAQLIAWKERQAQARGETAQGSLFPGYQPLPDPGVLAILPVPTQAATATTEALTPTPTAEPEVTATATPDGADRPPSRP